MRRFRGRTFIVITGLLVIGTNSRLRWALFDWLHSCSTGALPSYSVRYRGSFGSMYLIGVRNAVAPMGI